MKTIREVMAVRTQRDMIRDELVRSISRVENLPEEVRALLIADTEATQEFETTFSQYQEAAQTC